MIVKALSEEDACGTLRAMWRRTKMLKLKLILRREYGFRNLQNMTDMIMLCCSDLEVVLHTSPLEEPKKTDNPPKGSRLFS